MDRTFPGAGTFRIIWRCASQWNARGEVMSGLFVPDANLFLSRNTKNWDTVSSGKLSVRPILALKKHRHDSRGISCYLIGDLCPSLEGLIMTREDLGRCIPHICFAKYTLLRKYSSLTAYGLRAFASMGGRNEAGFVSIQPILLRGSWFHIF